MILNIKRITSVLVLLCYTNLTAQETNFYKTQGYKSLFNGKDLSQFVIPKGDGGNWTAFKGVIDCAVNSKAEKGKRHLFTKEHFDDFALHVEWRFKGYGSYLFDMPTVLPNGEYLLDEKGEKITRKISNADSGIMIKGIGQVNLWCWDIGSGELWELRKNKSVTAKQRAAAVPTSNQDNPVGAWNAMDIYVIGDKITVINNGIIVIDNAYHPGIDKKGPIGLQHHGNKHKSGRYGPISSLVQFKNIWVKSL